MDFDLKQKYTANGWKLACKFWDFLTFKVGKTLNTSWKDKQFEKWAVTFDRVLQTHSFEPICDVFDYYMKEWEEKQKYNEKAYVYVSPEAFIGDLYFLEQRYEWNTRPIP